MSRKVIARVLVAGVLVMAPVVAWGAGSGTGTVTVNCVVDEFFEFPAGMTVNLPHITAISQTKTQTATFTCYMNHANATHIDVTAGGDGFNGTLTGPGGKTLTTMYGIEGTGIQGGSQDPAGTAPQTPANLFLKAYNVVAAAGPIQIKLTVEATSDADPTKIPTGTYTCDIVLTASW